MTITGGRRATQTPPRTAVQLIERPNSLPAKSINNAPISHHHSLRRLSSRLNWNPTSAPSSISARDSTNSPSSPGILVDRFPSFSVSAEPQTARQSESGEAGRGPIFDRTALLFPVVVFRLIVYIIFPTGLHEGVAPTSMRNPALMKHELNPEPF